MNGPTFAEPGMVWLVTGVSSGFGQALAEELMDAGVFVIGTSRSTDAIDAFNDRHAGHGVAISLDLTKPDDIAGCIALAIEEEGRIDALVNNAGTVTLGPVEEIAISEARLQMETNFFGQLALTKAVLPMMREARSGLIIQVSSAAAIVGGAGIAYYCASKGALEAFSEGLASEVAPLGIRVVLVEPAGLHTSWLKNATDGEIGIAEYEESAGRTMRALRDPATHMGDRYQAARAVIEIVRSGSLPIRIPLGRLAIASMRNKIHVFEESIDACERITIDGV
jgi:NAD(P)-dependent dehydrogenase (short-subunit alcohol dehydrogenase family)